MFICNGFVLFGFKGHSNLDLFCKLKQTKQSGIA